MTIPKQILVWLILFLLTSCTGEKSIELIDAIEKQHNGVSHLIAGNGDTLIGAKRRSGILISTDGGHNWEHRGQEILFDEVNIDEHGVLWGLDSWAGIHEPAYARMFYSYDWGNTWETIEFEPDRFLPITFTSSPYQKMAVKDLDGKHWDLTPNNITDLVIPIPEDKRIDFVTYHEPYIITDQYWLLKQAGKRAWYAWDSLVQLDDLRGEVDMINIRDSLFIAGINASGSDSFLGKIVHDSIRIGYHIDGFRVQGITRDDKNQVWAYGDKGIFLWRHDQMEKRY